MPGETPTPQEAAPSQQPASEKDEAAEGKVRFNSDVVEHILTYAHSLEDSATEGTVVLGSVAKEWLEQSGADPTWSPKDFRTFWGQYEKAAPDKKTKFLASADLIRLTYDRKNEAAIKELLEAPVKLEPPEKIRTSEARVHTDSEKQAIIGGIVEVGSTKKFGRAEQWRLVKGAQERLRALNVHEDWFSTEPEKTTPETFMDVYRGASSEGQKAFREKVDFTRPPKENAVALEELAPQTKAAAPKPEAPASPGESKKEEAPKFYTASEILETLKAKKDPFVEAVRQDAQKAQETGKAKNETNPTAQRAFEVASRTVYDLETTAKHYETFFPETLNEDPVPLLLLKQTTDLRDLAGGLQTIYGKNIPREILFGGKRIKIEEELDKRIQNAVAKAVFQGWAGETKEAVTLDYPKELEPVSHITPKQREMLEWLGRNDAATAKIHERHQVWTRTIRYGTSANETRTVNEKGYLRVEAAVKIPSPEDKDYIKEVMGGRVTQLVGGETEEGNTEREWMHLNAAKAEGMGILLHLKPEFAQKIPEHVDRYLQNLPEGFRASEELKESLEKLKANPADEIRKAKFRKELFAEWVGLTVTCPEYMAKNFRDEFVLCLEILSEPFQRSDTYANRFLREANEHGTRRYGERGFNRFPTL